MRFFEPLLFILCVAFFSACGKDRISEEENPLKAAESINKTYTLGAAPVKLYLTLSKKEITLIDYLFVKIRVESDPDVKITPPYLDSEVYGPLMLTEAPKYRSGWIDDNRNVFHEWVYQFEPLSSGDYSLGAFNLYFRLRSEKVADKKNWPLYTLPTEAVEYRVKSLGIESTGQIKGIKGPIVPKFNYFPLLSAVLFILLSLLLGYLLSRRKNVQNSDDSEAIRTPDYYLETINALDRLEKQDLISQAKFEELYIRLCAILRAYFENYFGIPAQEQTTEEFIREISISSRFSLEQQHVLDQFFHLTDLVKFANFNPGNVHSLAAMKSVRSFVQSTRESNEI